MLAHQKTTAFHEMGEDFFCGKVINDAFYSLYIVFGLGEFETGIVEIRIWIASEYCNNF